jgi:hypothetical protein
MYIRHKDGEMPVGAAMIEGGKTQLQATQYGEQSGLFPMELDHKNYKDSSWVDELHQSSTSGKAPVAKSQPHGLLGRMRHILSTGGQV